MPRQSASVPTSGQSIASSEENRWITTRTTAGKLLSTKARRLIYAMQMSLLKKNPGGVLLSHTASRAVPSAPKSLTSEFGMGSGVASSMSPPEIFGSFCVAAAGSSYNHTVLRCIARLATRILGASSRQPALPPPGLMFALEIWSSRTTY